MLGLLKIELEQYRRERKFNYIYIIYLTVMLLLTRTMENMPYIILAIVFLKNIVLIQTSLQMDENNNWEVYRLSLPVRRKEIILSKYIMVFFKLFLDLLVCLGLTFIILHNEIDYLLYFKWFSIYFILFTFMISVFLPVFYRLGFIKSSNINIMLILAVALLIYMYIVNFGFKVNLGKSLYLILVLVSIISLVISYRLSSSIYRKRDL